MSELQNKVVSLIQLRRGLNSLVNVEERRTTFIKHAIALYYRLGGNEKDLLDHIHADVPVETRIDEEVGNALFELAAIGHLQDVDVIQAAYNRIDGEITKATAQRKARPARRPV